MRACRSRGPPPVDCGGGVSVVESAKAVSPVTQVLDYRPPWPCGEHGSSVGQTQPWYTGCSIAESAGAVLDVAFEWVCVL